MPIFFTLAPKWMQFRIECIFFMKSLTSRSLSPTKESQSKLNTVVFKPKLSQISMSCSRYDFEYMYHIGGDQVSKSLYEILEIKSQ